MKKTRIAFTLVELIVVVTILSILGTIAFISLQGYSQSARNSVRISDMSTVVKGLSIYILRNSSYPDPDDITEVKYEGMSLWKQGNFGKLNAGLTGVSNRPIDPLTKSAFGYSVTNDGLEYQLSSGIEGDKIAYLGNSTYASHGMNAYVKGDYNGLVLRTKSGSTDYVLAIPSVISSDLSSNDIKDIIQNKKLVYNDYSNLPDSYRLNITESLEGFNFSPDINNIVVYSGSINGLNEQGNQVLLVDNLQKYYSGTTLIGDNSTYRKLSELSIDFLNPSSFLKSYACNVVNFNLNHYVGCNGLDFITFYVVNVLKVDISNIPGNTIESVFQDSSSNYWFGTDEGLAHFDGSNWTTYTKENSPLVNNNVTSIAEDTNGWFWFGTVNGISKFDGDTEWITYSKDVLVSTHIQYIFTSNDGNVWIGTNKGVSLYNNDVWNEYTKKRDGLSHNNIRSIFDDENGNVWFGTNSKGVDKFETATTDITNYQPNNTGNGLPSKSITYIYKSSNGTFWFGTEGGLGRAVGNPDITSNWTGFTFSNTSGGLQSNNITYVYEDDLNNIWVGTNLGLSKFDGSNWVKYNLGNGLNGNFVHSVYQDDSNNVLVLTDGGMNTIDGTGNIID